MEEARGAGIREGMGAQEVLRTLEGRYGGIAMPTISVTFWLVSEGVYYIANGGVQDPRFLEG